MQLKLFLLIDKSPTKIGLEKYKLHDLGEGFFENGHLNLKVLKRRIEICFDLRAAVEEAGFDSFKIIKQQVPLTFIILFNDENYEIRNIKLKEASIINMLIDFISNLLFLK